MLDSLCQLHSHLAAWPWESTPQWLSDTSDRRRGSHSYSLNPVTSAHHLWVSPFTIFCRSWRSKLTLVLPHPTNGLICAHAINRCSIHQKAGWNQLVLDFWLRREVCTTGGKHKACRLNPALHLILSGPAPCFYPVAAPSSLPLVKE